MEEDMSHFCPKPPPREIKENLKRKRQREVLSDDVEEEELKLEVVGDCPNQPLQGFEGEAETVAVEEETEEDWSYESSPRVHLDEQCDIGMAPGDSITYRVLMEHLSKMAIEKYNKYMKANLEFKDILRATSTLCCGINYYIVFGVEDLSALEDTAVHFKALVNKFEYECEVVFCIKESGDEEGYNTCIHDYPDDYPET